MKVLYDLGTAIFSVAIIKPDPEDESSKKILDNKIKGILTRLGATHFICFVDEKGNFRKKVKHDYKGNRTSTPPESLGMLKQHVIEKWKAVGHAGLEADDIVAITHTHYKNKGVKNMIVVSGDKDMQQLDGVHGVTYKSDLTRKDVDNELAFRNLYNQMIQGDSADNIKGIPGFGPAKFAQVANGVFSGLIGQTDIPAIEKNREHHAKVLEMLYLLEVYLYKYGIIKGTEEFAQNFLCLYLKRDPIFGFEIPKWRKRSTDES